MTFKPLTLDLRQTIQWLTVASVMSYAWLKKELGGEQEDKKK